jgi:hypothetical protein
MPGGAECHVENKGDAIAATNETAAAGNRSLKIVDAPGLQHQYNPHYVYQLKHSGGTTRCSFDIRIGDGVRISHEWRDWSISPYAVGPSLSIDGTKLKIAGVTMLELPLETWVHFEISATLGRVRNKTWDLTVTLPGQTPKEFKGLQNGHATFDQLTWVGFVSNATEKTIFYMDNITLTNKV